MNYVAGALGVAVVLLLAALGWEYAEVQKRDATIAANAEAAATEKATFLGEAAKQMEAKQNELVQANKLAADAAAARDVARSRADGADKRVRDLIASASRPHDPGLPQTADSTERDAAAQALGVLAGQLDEFAGRCAAESDRLGDEVRRLEASYQ